MFWEKKNLQNRCDYSKEFNRAGQREMVSVIHFKLKVSLS